MVLDPKVVQVRRPPTPGSAGSVRVVEEMTMAREGLVGISELQQQLPGPKRLLREPAADNSGAAPAKAPRFRQEDRQMAQRRTRVNRAGFTLIELLVVIAIIAILAVILFPVFARTREKARSSTCLSNQKQTNLAFSMYAQDYDETFPFPYFQTTDLWWQEMVNPYIKATNKGGVLGCPSAPSAGFASSMNEAMGGKSLAFATNPSELIMTGDAPQVPRLRDRLTGLNRANPYFIITLAGSEGLWNGIVNFKNLQGLGDTPLLQNLLDEDTDNALGLIRFRHNSGSNVSFVDGHTRFMHRGGFKLRNWLPAFQNQ
jgi:prepilin-type N-terminal cleavage/methylation domain-containing protein/prepilin-type processing-associated H-X9-DG protein